MQYPKGNWYDQYIEDPLKELVKYLRNNGINTECSCGHDMYIQCQFMLDGTIQNLHKLVWVYLAESNKYKKLGLANIDFKIEVIHEVTNGHSHTFMEVKLMKKQTNRERLIKKKKYYEDRIKCIEEDLKRSK